MERPRDFASDDPETGTVRTNDVETYYVRRGSGPPIVLVHGMAMSASQWDSQQRALADEFTTVAYDVRGHGRTGRSDPESYGMALYASDLDALLTSLDFDRPILCGLSMGGCIVQAYAAAYPDRVAGLVLADTFTAAPLPLAGRLVFANLRLFARLDRVVRYTTLNRVQTWVGERLAPGVAGDGETTQRLMEDAPTIPHAEFAKVARSVAAVPTSDLDASRITAPTLVLYGEHAPAFLRAIHAGVADRLGNAPVDVVAVPDAGHASNVDNPAFFAEAVRSFARRMVAD
jgi:pimeloyl-ACP methyl ester carboxylesterase